MRSCRYSSQTCCKLTSTDLALLRLPTQLELLPVLRGGSAGGWRWRRLVALPPRLLFEGLTSGAGVPCDWTAARRVARRTELVLAGGLNPANVAAAIAAVQPVRRRCIDWSRSPAGCQKPGRNREFCESGALSPAPSVRISV